MILVQKIFPIKRAIWEILRQTLQQNEEDENIDSHDQKSIFCTSWEEEYFFAVLENLYLLF